MTEQFVYLPDVGDLDGVTVVELFVGVGDTIEKEQSLVLLEGNKASVEVPSPLAGKVTAVHVKVGDQATEKMKLLSVTASEAAESKGGVADDDTSTQQPQQQPEQAPATDISSDNGNKTDDRSPSQNNDDTAGGSGHDGKHGPTATVATNAVTATGSDDAPAHASPAIRRFARELGVDLQLVRGSGRKGRIIKDDVTAFVKNALQNTTSTGGGLPATPHYDYAKYGPIDTVALSKLKRVAGMHLQACWVNIPHVTQFGHADVTELEAFRAAQKAAADKRGVRLTPLVFIIKAVIAALQRYPQFNASLSADGNSLILKRYYHIGVAVDTKDGLVVPVVRDADKKGLFALAEELATLSERARNGKLLPADMQGGSISVSSLGGIGGDNFTPIVNAPEVAIVGISKMTRQAVWNEQTQTFTPRLVLPLSVSYDHRVIDGADGARFISTLGELLTDIRGTLL